MNSLYGFSCGVCLAICFAIALAPQPWYVYPMLGYGFTGFGLMLGDINK